MLGDQRQNRGTEYRCVVRTSGSFESANWVLVQVNASTVLIEEGE